MSDPIEHFRLAIAAAGLEAPGVGVVAVKAAVRTALGEDDETHPRPVHRAERFDRVDVAVDGLRLARTGSDSHGLLPPGSNKEAD